MNGQGLAKVVFPSLRSFFTPAVTVILILFVVFLILNWLATEWVVAWLALHPSKVLHGCAWQVLTYWMIPTSPMSLLLEGSVILMVGSAVERQWKSWSFVALWLVTCSLCGLIWVLVNAIGRLSYVGTGASAGCFGLIGAFGLLFRGQRFFFFLGMVKAQTLAWILIGLGVLASLPMPIGLIWVLGAAVSFLYIKLLWKAGARSAGRRSGQSPYQPGRFVDIE
jgi:membrane associated rhomboid family serine protease